MAFPGSQTSRRQEPRAGFSEEGGTKEGRKEGWREGGRLFYCASRAEERSAEERVTGREGAEGAALLLTALPPPPLFAVFIVVRKMWLR